MNGIDLSITKKNAKTRLINRCPVITRICWRRILLDKSLKELIRQGRNEYKELWKNSSTAATTNNNDMNSSNSSCSCSSSSSNSSSSNDSKNSSTVEMERIRRKMMNEKIRAKNKNCILTRTCWIRIQSGMDRSIKQLIIRSRKQYKDYWCSSDTTTIATTSVATATTTISRTPTTATTHNHTATTTTTATNTNTNTNKFGKEEKKKKKSHLQALDDDPEKLRIQRLRLEASKVVFWTRKHKIRIPAAQTTTANTQQQQEKVASGPLTGISSNKKIQGDDEDDSISTVVFWTRYHQPNIAEAASVATNSSAFHGSIGNDDANNTDDNLDSVSVGSSRSSSSIVGGFSKVPLSLFSLPTSSSPTTTTTTTTNSIQKNDTTNSTRKIVESSFLEETTAIDKDSFSNGDFDDSTSSDIGTFSKVPFMFPSFSSAIKPASSASNSNDNNDNNNNNTQIFSKVPLSPSPLLPISSSLPISTTTTTTTTTNSNKHNDTTAFNSKIVGSSSIEETAPIDTDSFSNGDFDISTSSDIGTFSKVPLMFPSFSSAIKPASSTSHSNDNDDNKTESFSKVPLSSFPLSSAATNVAKKNGTITNQSGDSSSVEEKNRHDNNDNNDRNNNNNMHPVKDTSTSSLVSTTTSVTYSTSTTNTAIHNCNYDTVHFDNNDNNKDECKNIIIDIDDSNNEDGTASSLRMSEITAMTALPPSPTVIQKTISDQSTAATATGSVTTATSLSNNDRNKNKGVSFSGDVTVNSATSLSNSDNKNKGVCFSDDVAVNWISFLHDSCLNVLFWTEEELGEFRNEAFMEECGLDPKDYE